MFILFACQLTPLLTLHSRDFQLNVYSAKPGYTVRDFQQRLQTGMFRKIRIEKTTLKRCWIYKNVFFYGFQHTILDFTISNLVL